MHLENQRQIQTLCRSRNSEIIFRTKVKCSTQQMSSEIAQHLRLPDPGKAKQKAASSSKHYYFCPLLSFPKYSKRNAASFSASPATAYTFQNPPMRLSRPKAT